RLPDRYDRRATNDDEQRRQHEHHHHDGHLRADAVDVFLDAIFFNVLAFVDDLLDTAGNAATQTAALFEQLCQVVEHRDIAVTAHFRQRFTAVGTGFHQAAKAIQPVDHGRHQFPRLQRGNTTGPLDRQAGFDQHAQDMAEFDGFQILAPARTFSHAPNHSAWQDKTDSKQHHEQHDTAQHKAQYGKAQRQHPASHQINRLY